MRLKMSHSCELVRLCRTHHYGEELVLRRRAVVGDGRQRRRRNLVIRIACAFRRSATTPTVYCGGTPCSRGGQAGSSGATFLPVLLRGAALARHSTQRSSEYWSTVDTPPLSVSECSRESAEGGTAAEGGLSVPLVSIDARFLFASDARRATLPEGKKLQRRQSLQ